MTARRTFGCAVCRAVLSTSKASRALVFPSADAHSARTPQNSSSSASVRASAAMRRRDRRACRGPGRREPAAARGGRLGELLAQHVGRRLERGPRRRRALADRRRRSAAAPAPGARTTAACRSRARFAAPRRRRRGPGRDRARPRRTRGTPSVAAWVCLRRDRQHALVPADLHLELGVPRLVAPTARRIGRGCARSPPRARAAGRASRRRRARGSRGNARTPRQKTASPSSTRSMWSTSAPFS